MVFVKFGMLSSTLKRAWAPPISVLTQPGGMDDVDGLNFKLAVGHF